VKEKLKCHSCGQIKNESEFRDNPNAAWRRCTECARKNRLKGATRSSLTELDKEYIRDAYKLKLFNGKQLAKFYGVSDVTIYRILNTGKTKKIRTRNNKIREEFAKGTPIRLLAEKYKLDPEWIARMQFSLNNSEPPKSNIIRRF
jgi:hypothetical protein